MKIVYVDDDFLPSVGYMINFVSKWNIKHGHEVTIITSDNIDRWKKTGFINNNVEALDKKFEKKVGAKIIRIKSYLRISGRQVIDKKIFDVVSNEKPNIVHVRGITTLTGLRFIHKIDKIDYPIIFDCHMAPVASKNRLSIFFEKYMRSFITPKIVKNNIKIIAVSLTAKEFLKKSYGIPDELIPVIHLGVDTDLFRPDKEQRIKLRKKMGLEEDSFVIIYTGKISREKKVLLLAKAFRQLLLTKINKSVYLMIVGSGSGKYYKKIMATLKSVKENVFLIPTQKVWELPKYYQASDVAVWPGACSLSTLDAQACELPIIAERNLANRERLKYNNGWLFEPNNVRDLTNKLIDAIKSNPETLKLMGLNGRNVIEKKSYKTISRRIESLMFDEIKKMHL